MTGVQNNRTSRHSTSFSLTHPIQNHSQTHSGFLLKRSKYLKIWRRRWCVLDGSNLIYYKSTTGPKLGEIDLSVVAVRPLTQSEIHRRFCFEISTKQKRILLQSADGTTCSSWIQQIRHRAASTTTPRKDDNDDNSFGPQLHSAEANGTLPSQLEITGLLEVGTELRVHSVDRPLKDLSIAWFTYEGSIPIDRHADISLIPGARYIEKATSETYVVQDADQGKRIGCSCRTVLGRNRVTVVSELPIQSVDRSVVSARVKLETHEHSRYCDRRVRVCTAPGRYREHAILSAIIRGPPKLIEQYRIRWFISDVVPSDAQDKHSTFKLTNLMFHRVVPRSISDIPPAPPDWEAAPKIEDIRDKINAWTLHRPSTEPIHGVKQYPLFVDDIGRYIVFDLVPVDKLDEEIGNGEGIWPLWGISSISDTSDMANSSAIQQNESSRQLFSTSGYTDTSKRVCALPAGPVEPSPPKAREIWIEGDQRVGGLLVGRCYYFGGHQGQSQVSWIKITPSGESVVLVNSVAISSDYKPPTTLSEAIEAEARQDPTVLRLTEQELGCLIKYKVLPIRSDGDIGHTESSRPTIEIKPATDPYCATKNTPITFDNQTSMSEQQCTSTDDVVRPTPPSTSSTNVPVANVSHERLNVPTPPLGNPGSQSDSVVASNSSSSSSSYEVSSESKKQNTSPPPPPPSPPPAPPALPSQSPSQSQSPPLSPLPASSSSSPLHDDVSSESKDDTILSVSHAEKVNGDTALASIESSHHVQTTGHALDTTIQTIATHTTVSESTMSPTVSDDSNQLGSTSAVHTTSEMPSSTGTQPSKANDLSVTNNLSINNSLSGLDTSLSNHIEENNTGKVSRQSSTVEQSQTNVSHEELDQTITPPHPWQELTSDEGDVYYYNTETGESVWELPPENR